MIFHSYRSSIKLSEFHEKELNGIVTFITSGSGGTKIKLNDESEKHLIITEYNDEVKSFFYRFVKKGDSIYKAPFDKFVHIFNPLGETLFETTQ